MQKSFSFNQAEIDTMRRSAWRRLATRHQGEMWPLTNDHCSRTALPLTLPETHKLAAWESSVHWAKHFVHRIARIWTRLTCHLRRSSADGIPSSKFLLSWQKWRDWLSKYGRNYRMVQSLPIHHFITFLFTVNVIRQMAPLFSKVDSNKLWHDVQNEEIVICAKFGKDLFNISKLIGRKTKWPRFFGLPGICNINVQHEAYVSTYL